MARRRHTTACARGARKIFEDRKPIAFSALEPDRGRDALADRSFPDSLVLDRDGSETAIDHPSGDNVVELPEEMHRLVQQALNAAFGPVMDAQPDDQPRHTTLSPAIERLRRPAAAYERREGTLIEALIVQALVRGLDERHVWGATMVPVWAVCRSLSASNAIEDISRLTVPLEGLPESHIEFDAIVVSRDESCVYAVEIKRNPAAITAELLANMRAGCLALRHQLARQGVYIPSVRPVAIAWYGNGGNEKIVTRQTIDAFFGVPVASYVDTALTVYKRAFERRYWGLVSELRDPGRAEPGIADAPEMATPETPTRRITDVLDEFVVRRR